MIENLAQVLRGQEVFVEGVGFIGKLEKIELPKVEFKIAQAANGCEVDSGRLDKLETKVEIAEHNPVLWEAVGKRLGETASIVIKKLTDGGGKSNKILVEMGGWIKTQEFGNAKVAEIDTVNLSMSVISYKLEIDGKPVYEIDLPNGICKINGKDHYDAIRRATW